MFKIVNSKVLEPYDNNICVFFYKTEFAAEPEQKRGKSKIVRYI